MPTNQYNAGMAKQYVDVRVYEETHEKLRLISAMMKTTMIAWLDKAATEALNECIEKREGAGEFSMEEKRRKASDLAHDIANTSDGDTDVTPKDIESWRDDSLYEWLSSWNFEWNPLLKEWEKEAK